ncbi:MAG TPA: hypothetical protein VE644_02495 [Gaiellaceae bacterium]|jgi:hypothetical protein|nr:hypothetical protein [Gaiellaceae bacterium]
MRAGEVIGEAWEAYKAHFRHLIPIAFVVYLLIALLTLLLVVLLGFVGAFVGFFIGIAGVFWLQGALVVAIADVRDGRADLSLGETLSQVKPKLNTLALAGILAALGVGIGLLLLIVPGLILWTWWLVIVPVIMLEGTGVKEAFGRSRQLVRGHGWSVFGVLVLTILILVGVDLVFSLVAAALDNVVIALLLDIASQTLTAPFIALAWTLTYYRLRRLEQPAAEPPPEFAA